MAVIAIDLTPVLPGGENGGAKVLVLSLIKALIRISPEHTFILLTAKCSHDELALLDGKNVRRVCVHGCKQEGHHSFAYRSLDFFSKLFDFLAQKIQPKIIFLGFQLQKISRKLKTKTGLLTNLGVDLLFCPFTDPRYAEPGITVVSIIYDLQHRDYPEFFTAEERQHRDIFFNDAIRRTDTFVCISEYTRQSFLKYFNVKQQQTTTIHIAIQDRIRKKSCGKHAETLAGLGIENQQYMFYPANFWPHKNHRMLLTSYSMLLTRTPSCPLHLVFTGALEEEEKRLRFAVRQMGLADKVHFLGYLSDSDLAAVWNGCQFLIFPSLYEGFGIPVIEAMSLGKPVLCSSVTSLPEVAGDAALLFDPRKPKEIVQCIEDILASPDLATTLAEKGKQRAACFKEDDMARQYLNVFKSMPLKSKQYHNSITGVFPDHWAGTNFSITFESCKKKRTLSLDISLPEGVPFKHTKVTLHNNSTAKHWKLLRGEQLTVVAPLATEGGEIDLTLSTTFIPSKIGVSKDNRELSVQVNKCAITTDESTEDLLQI